MRALADEITDAVNYMFANCKLDPAPDVALHPLLAKLLADTQVLHRNIRSIPCHCSMGARGVGALCRVVRRKQTVDLHEPVSVNERLMSTLARIPISRRTDAAHRHR